MTHCTVAISGADGVPQRLKPDLSCAAYGTAEAVPLSKADGAGKGSAIYHCPGEFPVNSFPRGTSVDISDWRSKIDELDEQIVRLISQRAQAASAIGELKRTAQLPVYEPNREQAVFDHIRAVNPGPLPDAEILHIYERIIDVMRTLQRRQD
jgi:chorismate mutase-like protein